jgi:translation initiation factor IF-2
VEAFNDPIAALARAREAPFDVILSDYRMPQMDGITFLHAVKDSQEHAVRMILSASTEVETIMKAINDVEAFRYLTKPWHEDELIDQIKEAMAGLLDPEHRETVIGHAEVKQVFQLSRGIVAGCLVTDGRIARTARARVLRRRQPVYDGGLSTLRRFQDDVKEVRVGLECGIKLGDFNEYQVGDVIECYQLEQVPQKL